MTPRYSLAAATAVLALLGGCATTAPPASVADTIAKTPQLSTLNKLVNDSGLVDTLRGPGPFTVFAPTDDAFKAVPAATMTALGSDKDRLKAVLMYHVVPGKVAAADVKNGPAKTAQGTNVALARAGTFVTVDDAVVTGADVAATNGVVHVVDRVLLPPR
ncbi:MAG: fasciclin domain-containing protein [Hyphomicrobium sp.]|nr:fasciclin domain-containing protein [Hyphomicrobium sp.]